jgi:hypothetical protein
LTATIPWYHKFMNSKHRKTLAAIFADPVQHPLY